MGNSDKKNCLNEKNKKKQDNIQVIGNPILI